MEQRRLTKHRGKCSAMQYSTVQCYFLSLSPAAFLPIVPIIYGYHDGPGPDYKKLSEIETSSHPQL